MTLCGYRVACDDVVDGVDYDATTLACAWELHTAYGQVPPSWVLARRLIAEGAAAIIVPSFAPGAASGDRNLVFWQWGESLPHQVVVIDTLHRLPHDARSWE